MEFPRRAVNVERALAAALLAAALGAAWAESGSALAARARDGGLWTAWIEARETGRPEAPTFHLALYDTAARKLTVLHVPGELKLDKKRSLERAYLEALKASGDPSSAARAAEDLAETRLRELSPEPFPAAAARLRADVAPLSPEDEPSIAAARALKARGRSPRAWLALARAAWRGLRSGDRTAADPLIFALELRRVPRERVEPARLPDDAQAPALLGRLLGGPPPDEKAGRPTTAEVLNAAGTPGLASRASKMLRLRGVDVLTTASAAKPRERTLVLDRVGDFDRAVKTLDALGCPSARAVTRVDASRAVDVSVELGADCAEAGPGDGREP